MVPTPDKGATSPDDALRQRSALSQAIMLGTNVAAGMILFTLLGFYLDYKRGTGRFWTVAGAIMGLAYAAYEFWSTLRMLRQSNPDKPKTGPGNRQDGGGKPGEPGVP